MGHEASSACAVKGRLVAKSPSSTCDPRILLATFCIMNHPFLCMLSVQDTGEQTAQHLRLIARGDEDFFASYGKKDDAE